MVVESLYKSLRNLISIDKKLDEINSKIKKAEKLLNKDNEDINKLKSDIERKEKLVNNSQKKTHLLELDTNSLKENENKINKKLEEITNPKLYKSIEKEKKAIELKSLEAEDQLIKEWNQLENLKKDLVSTKNSSSEKIQQLKESLSDKDRVLADQKKELIALKKNRDKQTQNIPSKWFSKYERMKNKVSNPIVPVLNSACSACYYSILRQDLAKLKQGEIIPCKNCYRFMYYDLDKGK